MTKQTDSDSKPAHDEPKGESAAPAAESPAVGTEAAGSGAVGRPSAAELAKRLVRRVGKSGVIFVVVALAFVVGYWASSGPTPNKRHSHDEKTGKGSKKKQMYTCSMHPQIQLPDKNAKCPICGMDLIPVDSGDAAQSSNPRELRMSARARKLAEIQVTPVVRKKAAVAVRVLGKVVYDERRVGYITSWVSGRIDRLFVKFTGAKVRRWQPMVYIYSPELVTTQMELIQAVKLARALKGTGVSGIGITSTATLEAARYKLRLLGLSTKQIAHIELRGKPVDHLTIHAPVGGVVIQKSAQEQMYVKPGTRLYTIADLSRVWVKLDVYESELGRVRVGQTISFTAEPYPGETFTGKVEFIDPFVDNRTRTVKVRLTAQNKDQRLKPDMFVRAVLSSPIDAAGKTQVANAKKPTEAPLVIPVSAPLITGKRAVVYVEVKAGTYRGREVVLGPRVGRYYVVREGLKEGEKVVTHGNFKIDSALQIMARPSMMNPQGGGPAPGHHHGGKRAGTGSVAAKTPVTRRQAPATFKAQLAAVTKAYYEVHHGLSRDKLDAAKQGAQKVLTALKAVQMGLLKGPAHNEWMADLKGLRSATKSLTGSGDIKLARRYFDALSTHLILAIRRFGLAKDTEAIRFRCTMAFDNRGADWIQAQAGVENPYFGSQMFRCGDQHESLTKPEVKRLAIPAMPQKQHRHRRPK
ncbi:MAG: efflux RND transporter periplasmic adaptor subunit [bacterium]